MTKGLVLGVGNILMQDEGIGVRTVEWLQTYYTCPDIEIIDGGTMGLDLLYYLEGTDHLLIVDAIQANKAPGQIITLNGDDIPAFLGMKISPHQVGVQDLLATAQLMGYAPPEIVILGVQPAQISVGLEMSSAVAAKIEPLARLVLVQLKEWGYNIQQKSKLI